MTIVLNINKTLDLNLSRLESKRSVNRAILLTRY